MGVEKVERGQDGPGKGNGIMNGLILLTWINRRLILQWVIWLCIGVKLYLYG